MRKTLKFERRKILSIILFVLILTSIVFSGYCFSNRDNNVLVFFDEELSEIVPIVKENEVYLPFRAVLENLGYEVDWDLKTWSAIAKKDDKIYIVKIGDNKIIEKTYDKEEISIEIDKQVELIESRTIVSSETISKITGLEIANKEGKIFISVKSIEKPTLEDDYFDYVNFEWLKNAQLNEGEKSKSEFEDLDREIKDLLNIEINDKLKKDISSEKIEMKNFINYYKGALNFNKRKIDGIKPLLLDLEKIEKIRSLDDISKNIKKLFLNDIKLPIKITITTDIKNTDKNVLALKMPDLIMDNEINCQEINYNDIKENQIKMYTNIIVMLGKSNEEAKKIAEEGIKFDEIISIYKKDPITSYDSLIEGYNIVEKKDILSISKNINFKNIMKSLVGELPEKIILTNKEYYNNIDKFLNEDNIEMIKSWMYLSKLSKASGYLSDKYEKHFNKMYLLEREEIAYGKSIELFGPVIGSFYGEKYFSEEEIKDVENITKDILEVYKSRVKKLDWLTDETKTKAIKKLNTISIKIGYSDNIPVEFLKFSYDDNKSFYDNNKNMNKILNEETLKKYYKKVDRDKWEMEAHRADAMYFPTSNTMVFPAGILQGNFYDINKTDSENYGSIGTIIAHEISHSLDPMGSKFDEKGNFIDWWSDKDRTEYEKRIKKMEELFDGIEFGNGHVNGKLTLGENIADAGGLSIAYEAVKTKKDFSPEKFFESWAKMWRKISTEEAEERLLKEDVHSPSKLRANIQLSNLDEFNEFYKLKETDKMYMAPKKRVRIW